MNKKALIPIFLLLAVGVFFSFRLTADKNAAELFNNEEKLNIEPFEAPDDATLTKNQAIQQTIMRVIQEGHFSPKEINDDFAKKVFNKYLEMSDYGKLFFTQGDNDEFSSYESKVDDEIQNGTTEFCDAVIAKTKSRRKDAENYCLEALKNPFTFSNMDEIELDGKKLSWCKDEDALKARWFLSMKFRTLSRLTELKEAQASSKDSKEKLKTVDTLEKEARTSVQKNMTSFFKRLNKISDGDYFASYINSICHVIDPHTDFFPPKDKQRFDEEISGTFYGIGAVLSIEDGNCKIQQIVTGSPCWKGGKLKNGDIILKVAQAAEDPVDIYGWDLEDIVSIIRGKEGSEVRLSVKHVDGSMEVISIKRGKVQMEDTFAKSVILKNNGISIGYILLPEFYADFNAKDGNGRRCAKDMEKEIQKLKSENVNGIIVDLRGNGGGSLNDVVEIGGMFVDKGPIVQVKSKGAAAQPLDDNASGILYDGPLTILVNQGSASASEILAAAMQDYKRAVILGATSFGKGTVQRVFSLEDFYQGDPNLFPFGSVKLTLQKFYRINGGSTQLKGVTPDVALPDLYELMDVGERKDENSMAWDQVAKADYKPFKSNVDLNTLIEASKKRVQSDGAFKLISQNALRVKKQSDDNRYSLNEKKYLNQIKDAKDFAKQMEEADKTKKLLVVDNLANEKPKASDTVAVKKNDDWIKLVKKDPYINEASNVIADWVKAIKNTPLGTINKDLN